MHNNLSLSKPQSQIPAGQSYRINHWAQALFFFLINFFLLGYGTVSYLRKFGHLLLLGRKGSWKASQMFQISKT
jgi:hypothetical protein